MAVDADFYNKLDSLTTYDVQQNVVNTDKQTPYVWFQRRSELKDVFLNGSAGLSTIDFDVEVIGEDINAVETEALSLRNSLNGFAGLIGTTQVLGCFVNDADDDYISKTIAADTGVHVIAFEVTLIY